MEFTKFSLLDSKTLGEVEEAFGSQISIGFLKNEREGLLNFPIIHKVDSGNDFKVSYSVLKNPKIPLHSHEKTQHIYAVMDGLLEVDVLYEKKAFVPYQLCALEGCFIPAGVPHTLNAEYAVLLCVEVPPDTNDFRVYEEI